MRQLKFHQVGADMIATDAHGHAVGLLRWIAINPAHEKRSASQTMLDRLNALPSTNAIRWKTSSNTEGA